ncbi:hypothetical protein [Tumebacillus avium]|uniref:hypothetical protein n=1 Tax=Tumebacillus avium TaxID=1903704 RepID=UPI0012FD22AC|nr:hypothetical protein [Tumebacillus avium]
MQATEEQPKLGKDVSFSEAPSEPKELVEARTANSKRFFNPDGSTKAKQGFNKAKKWFDDLLEGGGKKGCNCFTAGTKVLTKEGEKNIEDIL